MMKMVKFKRGFKKTQSSRWLAQHMTDPFVKEARRSGYRSRSAYKLIEINDRYKFLQPGKRVVDLGSTPGGWSQVAANFLAGCGSVISVDVVPMAPIPNVVFFNKSVEDCCKEGFLDVSVDVVLSDMAPNASGSSQLDHIRSLNLCMTALEFAKNNLCLGGTLVMKILQGADEQDLWGDLKKCFTSALYFKPKASRRQSSEIYIIAQNFFKT